MVEKRRFYTCIFVFNKIKFLLQKWHSQPQYPTGKKLALQNASDTLHHVKDQMAEFVTFAKSLFT